MANEYTADQIFDTNLYAKKKIYLYKLPSVKSEVAKIVEKGEKVGNVYSYVEREGLIFWMVDIGGNTFWTPHDKGLFDEERLKQQGAMTIEEVEALKQSEIDANKAWYERLSDSASNVFKAGENATKVLKVLVPVVIIGSGIALFTYIGLKIYKSYKS